MGAATTKLSSRQHIPSEEGHKSIDIGGWKKSMHAPTTVYFFMAKRSSHWINVPTVGPAGTRTMTFTVGTKPPREKTGIRRVPKGGTRILAPRGHSIRQWCKAEKNSLQKIWACMTNRNCHVKYWICHKMYYMTKMRRHAGHHITTVT